MAAGHVITSGGGLRAGDLTGVNNVKITTSAYNDRLAAKANALGYACESDNLGNIYGYTTYGYAKKINASLADIWTSSTMDENRVGSAFCVDDTGIIFTNYTNGITSLNASGGKRYAVALPASRSVLAMSSYNGNAGLVLANGSIYELYRLNATGTAAFAAVNIGTQRADNIVVNDDLTIWVGCRISHYDGCELRKYSATGALITKITLSTTDTAIMRRRKDGKLVVISTPSNASVITMYIVDPMSGAYDTIAVPIAEYSASGGYMLRIAPDDLMHFLICTTNYSRFSHYILTKHGTLIGRGSVYRNQASDTQYGFAVLPNARAVWVPNSSDNNAYITGMTTPPTAQYVE